MTLTLPRRRPLACLSLLPLLAVLVPAAGANPFKKSQGKLDFRIQRAADRFIEMQAEPGKRIPADLLARARGIIIMHSFKAGFGIGGEAGNGVALVRDKNTGRWSAPAFVTSAEGSYGLQIGAQESTTVLLLMNETGLKPLLGGNVDVGIDVSATAGPFDEGAKIDTTTIKDPILVYSTSGGLFAGAAFKGGAILPAQKNNDLYYGRVMNDVLFDASVRPTRTGQHLIDVIETYAGRRSN
jgi:lipid-binding SYLF domain-containing protein